MIISIELKFRESAQVYSPVLLSNDSYIDFNIFHPQTHAWLEGLFGGDDVPPYEINERTVTILHELMMKNKQQDELNSAIAADWQRKAEEYRLEGTSQNYSIYINL